MTDSRETVSVRSEEGEVLGDVSVSLAAPAEASTAVVIAHGAGGTMETPSLVSLQRALAENGVAAARFNFLYTERGRKTPDRQPILVACWKSVADFVRKELHPKRLVLAGRSMGGRMATYLAAEGYPADALVLLAYPLHPPGKRDRQRKDHLVAIRAPMLFVSGSRDSFAGLDLLEPLVRSLGAKLHLLEGADHGFKVPARLRKAGADVDEEVAGAVLAFVSELGG